MASKKFDYIKHNRKIAKKRGPQWKEKLRKAKALSNPHLTNLAQTRFSKNLTQADMMRLLKDNNCTIYSRIERAQSATTRNKAQAIAKILNESVNSIFIEYDKDKFLAF